MPTVDIRQRCGRHRFFWEVFYLQSRCTFFCRRIACCGRCLQSSRPRFPINIHVIIEIIVTILLLVSVESVFSLRRLIGVCRSQMSFSRIRKVLLTVFSVNRSGFQNQMGTTREASYWRIGKVSQLFCHTFLNGLWAFQESAVT